MSIYASLSSLKTWKEDGCCDFNGYLEDYLAVHGDNTPHRELFEQILAINESMKVIVGLRLDIKSDVITNRIIRYKDAFKNAEKAIYYEFVLYGKNVNDEDRAIIACDDTKEGYIYGKGLYYCMSEPNSIFDMARNELISCNYSELVEATKSLFTTDFKTGAIQRKLDQKQYANYDELFTICMNYANSLKENVKAKLDGKRDQEKVDAMKEIIIQWFLIKKVAYVQYMMNKSILMAVHNNDIKEQRTVAKENADKIPFYSFSEMWRL